MRRKRFEYDGNKYTHIPSETVTASDIAKITQNLTVYGNGFVSTAFSFDIETTSFYSVKLNENLACMYHWQIGLEKETITGRTWQEFRRILDLISDAMPDKAKLICWIQNFSFEWQFIKAQIKWNVKNDFPDLFAKTTRDILYARYKNIEFRDALALTAMGLKAYQKNFGLSIGKLDGDLDYKLKRHAATPLTKQELAYCINDVQVLNEWVYKYINPVYGELGLSIPLTSTGIVRSEIKEEFAKMDKDTKKRMRNRLKNAQPSREIYLLWRNFLFRGGYVHANTVQCNELLEEPFVSMDLKSAHPSQMLLEKFPWKFNRLNPRLFPQVLDEARNREYAFFGIFTFHNIRCKGWHSLESKNKIIEEDTPVYENGRLIYAKMIKVCLNEIDFFNYEDIYKWDDYKVTLLYQARLEPLPDYVRKVVLKYFELKENTPKDTLEYNLAKRKLNSCFGMAATSLPEREIVYNPESNELETSSMAKTYDELVRYLVMLPQWAIWIAAYTRRDIVRAITQCGQGGIDAIYYDTDSIKTKNYEKYAEWFQNFNAEKRAKVEAMECYDFDRKHFLKIGGFEYEYTTDQIKVLGCKRYMVNHDGKIQVTVAGMVKGSYEKWIKHENEEREKKGKTPLDIWETFTDDLTIPPPWSDKQTAIYYDQAFWDEMTDYKGNKMIVEEKSCCAIVDIPFSMNIETEFIERINTLRHERENAIYKGVL